MNLQEAKDFIFHQHDVVCNQKYGKTLPYSFHLDCVLQQGYKFLYLIEDVKARPGNSFSNERLRDWVLIGCLGHDLIEDARMTYNDVKDLFSEEIADIIYLCTEERGKDRAERHPESWYKALTDNKLATFVKLCDVIANVKFSLLTNSSMYSKYQKEFILHKHYYEKQSDLKPMVDYLERLLSF
jgi:hypothetical protein